MRGNRVAASVDFGKLKFGWPAVSILLECEVDPEVAILDSAGHRDELVITVGLVVNSVHSVTPANLGPFGGFAADGTPEKELVKFECEPRYFLQRVKFKVLVLHDKRNCQRGSEAVCSHNFMPCLTIPEVGLSLGLCVCRIDK